LPQSSTPAQLPAPPKQLPAPPAPETADDDIPF
jgi:hypothetical protein